MNRLPPLARRSSVLLVAVLLLACLGSTARADTTGRHPRYVLLLHSFDRDFAPFDTFATVFRTELLRLSPQPIVFVEIALQPSPNFTSPDDDVFLRYVQSIVANRKLDLVVPIGGPATAFLQKFRSELFPTTPILFSAVDRRFVVTKTLRPIDTAIAVDNDPALLVKSIVGVLPDLTHIFVVIGNSPLEQFWKTELTREFQQFTNRLTFAWADTYSFDEVKRQAGTLPPHSAILYILYAVDARGGPFTEEQALAELHNVANAPIFGFHSPQLGRGIVGGPLMPIEELGRTTSDVALRILHGESPASFKLPPLTASVPTYDWRELRRWHIDEARLPRGSIVRFRGSTAWQRYQWPLIGGIAFLLSQTILVIALFANRMKRRRAEHAVRESEARFRLLADSSPVMIWSAGTDMLCTDFNRQWLRFTGRPLDAELGNGWADGVHACDKGRCMRTYAEAFARREPFEMDYRLRRADGEYRWVLDCGVPRFDADGSFAGYVGSAIDITEQKAARFALATFSHRLMDAHETERTRIARELHDDLGQRLVGLTMLLYSLTDSVRADTPEARARFTYVCDQFTALGRDVTAISHRLHPALLDKRGLTRVAASLCREVSEQFNLQIDFAKHEVPSDLPREVTLSLFRVLQEALANAVKHSQSPYIKVTLRGGKRELHLEVLDHGIGFSVKAATEAGGIGLVTMRERLSLINGELAIESRPGGGTRVIAHVLLDQDDPPAAEMTGVPGRI